MRIGIIGSGSWGTALAKLITDNQREISWSVRNEHIIQHIQNRHHNPNYLHSVYFDTSLLNLNTSPSETFEKSDAIIIAVPSAYVIDTLDLVNPELLKSKKIISAVK
jgi:glycerol-3-phosphate dehydrogenase (NAD(P)+)